MRATKCEHRCIYLGKLVGTLLGKRLVRYRDLSAEVRGSTLKMVAPNFQDMCATNNAGLIWFGVMWLSFTRSSEQL